MIAGKIGTRWFLGTLLSMYLSGASVVLASPVVVEFDSLEAGRPTRLNGLLFKPDQWDEKVPLPLPGVVLLHGCSGMHDAKGELSRGIRFWSERFVRNGFVVLAVDSFSSRGHREICTKRDRPILESRERPRDAYGALRFLTERGLVRGDRVFLMGFSNGATATLYAVDEVGKPYELAKEAGVAFKAAIAFYPGCTRAEKRGLTPAIPLAIFMGTLDDWTPTKPCKDLIEKAKSAGKDATIFLYEDAYHGFDVPGSKLRVRNDVRMNNRINLENGVHVGGNETARNAAAGDVDAFLQKHRK